MSDIDALLREAGCGVSLRLALGSKPRIARVPVSFEAGTCRANVLRSRRTFLERVGLYQYVIHRLIVSRGRNESGQLA